MTAPAPASKPELLDARGLKCPLPVLKAHRLLRDMHAGATLRVLATDPAARREFTDFCAQAGYALVSIEGEEMLEILIEKR